MTIYLAAPLFSTAERLFNRQITEAIKRRLPGCEILLPQDSRVGRGASFNDRRNAAALYRQCIQGIDTADLVLSVLDGADGDSGVSFETGYAVGRGKRVVGIRTDFRQLQVKGLNVMLAEGCDDVVCYFSFDEDIDHLVDALLPHIEKIRAQKTNS